MKIKAEELAADKGEITALAGGSREDNPYPPDSELHIWWDFGWLSVTDEEKEAIKEMTR